MSPQEQHARHLTARTLVEALARVQDVPIIERELRVQWSNRMTNCAGYACYRHRGKRVRILKMSAVIMPHCPDEEIVQVTLHELAHLVSYERHDRRGAGHGSLWKATMRELGADHSDRTHDYHANPAVVAAAGFHVVQCLKCKWARGVTSTRARNWRRYGRRHGCGGDIVVLTPGAREDWLRDAMRRAA